MIAIPHVPFINVNFLCSANTLEFTTKGDNDALYKRTIISCTRYALVLVQFDPHTVKQLLCLFAGSLAQLCDGCFWLCHMSQWP